MPEIKGRLKYHGYISPAPGQHLSNEGRHLLARVYGKCREYNPGEVGKNKTKCAKIAWSVVKKQR